MIRLVTFSDDKMTESAKVCEESALDNGVDIVWRQNPDTIDSGFRQFNSGILDQSRGCGYWLWKPYHVYKAILQCQEGDILIYSDAGVKWISNVNEIISRMDQDIFLFSNGHQHVHWCKMDVCRAINHYAFNKERRIDFYTPFQQCQASVIFIKVNHNTRNFVKEWLLWCQMPGFIDDGPSKLPNHPEFAEHRHDQAILTCLAIKYEYKLHYWADARWYSTQRHRWPEDTYPLMFDHHRFRDKGKGDGKDPEWE
jgi:hypothetical protein